MFSSKTTVAYQFFLSTFNVNPVAAHLMGKFCQTAFEWTALSILRHPKHPRHWLCDLRQNGAPPL